MSIETAVPKKSISNRWMNTIPLIYYKLKHIPPAMQMSPRYSVTIKIEEHPCWLMEGQPVEVRRK